MGRLSFVYDDAMSRHLLHLLAPSGAERRKRRLVVLAPPSPS